MRVRGSLKAWYVVHKWTSLVCTVFALLLCLTGLPLIFSHEIDAALGYAAEPPALASPLRHASVDALVADARARNPGHAVQFLVGEPDEPDLWYVRMGKTVDAAEPSAFYSYDARTGGFLGEYPLGNGVMNVVLRLHVDLFAGLPGLLFLGCMGLLLAVSLVSGTVLYGHYMGKLRFGTVRHESARLKWLDLHNLLGIATLAWFLVVSLTGVVNTLADPIFGRWQATELAEMTAPHRGKPPLGEGYSVRKALEAALAAAPGSRLGFLAFPGNGFAGPREFVAFMQGRTPWTSKLLRPLLIDAETGAVLAQRELPLYVSALLLSKPLHFGDYGGLPLKLLWAALDLLCIGVLVSGLYLWLKKRAPSFGAHAALPREGENEFAAVPVAVKPAGRE